MILHLALLAICHFIADFICQSGEMARNKSIDPVVLFKHIGIHFLVFLVMCPAIGVWQGIGLSAINMALHGIIDWHVWRGYKALVPRRIAAGSPLWADSQWKFYDDHWFYVTIGFDQMLHGLSILLAYWVTCVWLA